tara:strand:- start:440 stop:556 length:117 start_codon:yes stop_codon:yes gene_type:complete
MAKIKQNKNIEKKDTVKKACDIFPSTFEEMNVFLYGKK